MKIVRLSLRRSIRLRSSKHLAPEPEIQLLEPISPEKVVVKDYEICAASIPDMLSPSEAMNDRDRDELILDPEALESADDISINKYALACGDKIGCDIHTAICHLATNQNSIQQALETIDDPESLPNKFVRSDNAPGIWNGNEIKTFIRLMNHNKCYKRFSIIRKRFPNKSTSNIVNAYYALKKKVCSSKSKLNICPEIIKKQKPFLGFDYVDSVNCDNCVNKLWGVPVVEEQMAQNLCSLCMLYKIMYGTLRLNAQVSPKIFDFSTLSHDSCNYETMKDYPHDEEATES